MSDYTYTAPDSAIFLHNLRQYLDAIGQIGLSALLNGAQYELSASGSFSHVRWNTYDATIRFYLPVERIAKLNDEMRKELLIACDRVFPRDAGYEITELEFSPILVPPPDDEAPIGNSASLVSSGLIEHDGLRFRSRSETRIYDELKRRQVLFFANATAVLGSKNVKREPDFLVCQDGKWGILEVMGEPYHPSATAMRDHDRARLFQDYGLYYIQFYDSDRCYNKPQEVVTDFLTRLARH